MDAIRKIADLGWCAIEGAFYAWTAQEIDEVLRDEPKLGEIAAATMFKERYGVKPSGNVDSRSDIQGELTGKVCMAFTC